MRDNRGAGTVDRPDGEARLLHGRTALVTGAGRGFGYAVAKLFLNSGANVAVHCRHSRSGVEELSRIAKVLGRRAVAVDGDLRDARAVDALVETAFREFERIDILVNNAGVMTTGSFADSRESDWTHDIEVNILGTLRVTRLVIPNMIANRYGKIINMSSQLALRPWEHGSVYAGTKGFTLSWTKSLASELGPLGINVNAIGPGSIVTDMNREIYAEDDIDLRVATLPLRRMGSPVDVAECALFLASSSSDFVTGQMLGVNGGSQM